MSTSHFGVVGLGVMGRNLALNARDAGVTVAGTDLDADAVAAFAAEGGDAVTSTTDLDTFLDALPTPRNILVMVPAGGAVDAVLGSLAPKLSPGDLVIDGGNSFYEDTQRRHDEMEATGIHFFGMGVSGGEDGARHGPSMMPGGPKEPYARVAPILEGMAATVDGEPCVAHLGAGASGHYVKMVHNGIEYGLMQLLAEAYDLLHRGAGLDHDRLADLFAEWNAGDLRSYLVAITADILRQTDDLIAGQPLLASIADTANQKGTGKWTSQDALDLGIPTPTIDAAVTARYLSALKAERVAASEILEGPEGGLDGDPEALELAVGNALHVAFLATYAQGFALMRAASAEYGFGLDPATVATVWRGGCIIRADMLETFREAFRADPDLANLMVAPPIAETLSVQREALAGVVAAGAFAGLPTPALAASLSYLDAYRTARLPANIVAAQRDYFGAHTYARIDRNGVFHTVWVSAES